MENTKITKEEIINLIKTRDFSKIREIFEEYPNIDIADALNELDVEDGDEFKYVGYLFKVVKPSYTSEVFSELDDDHKEGLIRIFTDKEIATIFEDINNDDIADFLEELPANLTQKVLKNINAEDRKQVNRLLGYKEDSAGSIMTTEYLTLLDTDTVDHALKIIRATGKSAETIYTLFVRNIKWDLVGVLNLDDLIFAKDEEKLIDVCETNFQTVNVNTDQEEVAQLFKRYDLNAIAVTNEDNKLTGIITIDDIIDVIEQETTEDIEAMAQVTPLENSYTETPIFRLVIKCIPWLIVLLVVSIGAIALQNQFQPIVAILTVVSIFLTLICDTGGNSGSQSSTLMIRGLSTGDFELKDYWRIIGKETLASIFIGLIVGGFAFGWIMFLFAVGIVEIPADNPQGIATGVSTWLILSTIVAITLFLTIVISKFIGASLPFILTKLKMDPAVIASPLISTISDLVSLGLYFGLLYIFLATGAFGIPNPF